MTDRETDREQREQALRQEICTVGRSLYERNYVHATAGNISVRLRADDGADDGFLITPTDACLGRLDPARLAHIDRAGRQVGGDPASKTLALHRRIYGADASAGCVLHTHSSNLVLLTLSGVWNSDDILPPITPYYVMKVGHVPLIEYRRPGDPGVAERVQRTMQRFAQLGMPLRAVMLDRLGPTVWHKTLAEASAVLEEMEQTAGLWLRAQPRPSPLSEAQIAELREQFGAIW